jgi:hypothetical protein
MEAKQKAMELAIKFCQSTDVVKPNFASVKMALKCVEEIKKDLKQNFQICEKSELHPHARGLIGGTIIFWNEVENELEEIK